MNKEIKEMKITIYELLGLVKDDKAPNKIKYINSIWEYDKETKDYFHDDLWLIYSMNSRGLIEREVEIIEEKLEDRARFQYSEIPTWLVHEDMIKVINENFAKHQKAIYEIMDCLKSKGE